MVSFLVVIRRDIEMHVKKTAIVVSFKRLDGHIVEFIVVFTNEPWLVLYQL